MNLESEELLRAQVAEALLDLCNERSFHDVTVVALCRRVGIDRATFVDHFGSLEDCALRVHQDLYERCTSEMASACEGLVSWRDRVRATGYALHRFFDADERVLNFMIVAVRTVGERSLLLLGAQIKTLLDLIDEGRSEPGAPGALTPATAESLGGGVFNQVYMTVAKGELFPPEGKIVPQVMYSVVLPYLGSEAAREELSIPPPPFPTRS